MLVVECPRCGRPVGVSMATPEQLVCRGCGPQGPAPASMVEAARTLSAIDLARRQLSDRQRKALLEGPDQRKRVRRWALVLSVPFLLWGAFIFSIREPLWMKLAAGVWPLVAFAVGCYLLLRLLSRSTDTLERACAATPPSSPGEPACCHVCSATLSGEGPVVRCIYCEADNLVSLEAMRRVQERHITSAGSLAEQIGQQAQSLATSATRVRFALVPVGIAAFVAVMLVTCFAIALTAIISGPPDPSHVYVLLPTSAGPCVVQAEKEGKGYVLLAGPWRHKDLPSETPRPSLEGLERIDVSTLLGRHVRVIDGEKVHGSGVVDEVFLPLGSHVAYVRFPDGQGEHRSHRVSSLCLDPPSP